MTTTAPLRGRTLVRISAALLTAGALLLTANPTRAHAAPCPASDTAPSAQTLHAAAGATICLVNAHRTSHGLRSLTVNADLVAAAASHSRDMVHRAFFAHNTPTGTTPSQRIRSTGYTRGLPHWTIGEDLAWGSGTLSTPTATITAWIASPAHNHVLLDPRVREIGVGIAIGTPNATPNGATYTLDSGTARH